MFVKCDRLNDAETILRDVLDAERGKLGANHEKTRRTSRILEDLLRTAGREIEATDLHSMRTANERRRSLSQRWNTLQLVRKTDDEVHVPLAGELPALRPRAVAARRAKARDEARDEARAWATASTRFA